jgi:hypothetical protein
MGGSASLILSFWDLQRLTPRVIGISASVLVLERESNPVIKKLDRYDSRHPVAV